MVEVTCRSTWPLAYLVPVLDFFIAASLHIPAMFGIDSVSSGGVNGTPWRPRTALGVARQQAAVRAPLEEIRPVGPDTFSAVEELTQQCPNEPQLASPVPSHLHCPNNDRCYSLH